MKRTPIVYPLLIAIFPVLSIYEQNAREVPPVELVLPIGVALAIAALLWAVAALALKDAHRGGLIAVLVLVFLGTAERIPGFVEWVLSRLSNVWVYHEFRFWPPTLIVPYAGLLAGLAYLVARDARRVRRWSPALNLFALILVAMPAVEIVTIRSQLPAPLDPDRPCPPLATLRDPGTKPDIYYIILDSFARGDILKELYGYDLEPFLAGLERRGFVVARRSTSNYCWTPLSLSSSLNGTYHAEARNDAEAEAGPDPALFRKNAVFGSLKPLGYRFVTFSSGFDFTEYPRADRYLSPFRHLSGFQIIMATSTPLRHLIFDGRGPDEYTMKRERVLYLLDELPRVAEIDGPTFAFAHLLAPHPPFAFGPDGEDTGAHHIPFHLGDAQVFRYYYGEDDAYIRGYRGEVAFLVKRVERMIDAILANSPEPPIIVLQSDHGSGLRLDMGSAERTDVRERTGILNAYYLPGGKREGLHDAITPVNSFRVIFNNYFGAGLDLLPEENYYTDWSHPFRFVRVTDRVRGRPEPAGRPVDRRQARATGGRAPALE